MLKQVHLYIKGDVIGVGFRAWTKIQAKINKVNGWVRNVHNRPDLFGPSGGVEAVFQADEEKINKMVALVKAGPPVARIENVEILWQDVRQIIESFEIRK